MKGGAEWRDTFDEWADEYDPANDSDGFPFAGYESVLERVLEECDVRKGRSILDLGIGTGTLAEQLIEAGCDVCGIDLSEKMLARARERCPTAELVCADLTSEWPAVLNGKYERIVSTYAFHHFDAPFKVELISRLFERTLSPGGRIIIGDIAFEDEEDEARHRLRSGGGWGDDDEYFWHLKETGEALGELGLSTRFERASFCAGVFTILRVP
jgi:putative AdoMet-dependent methyltransferase